VSGITCTHPAATKSITNQREVCVAKKYLGFMRLVLVQGVEVLVNEEVPELALVLRERLHCAVAKVV
jgi:hypothetical protein